ncbi:potassium transporter Kup [Parvibaculum sp.]|uniref:potassium transporter Kup n=1 Tax=Parvibaculum sp. TaxID=2024848 RepID=UPI002B57F144|nr:potassium transporter Kup [Parvibaculum sp.]HUD50396.1 potassium transporter Kup [Parvibaculum sp.]
MGVVFGDIGTSPLYTIRQCFDPAVGLKVMPETVVGVLSLVFWAITLVVMIKYVIFILRADNKGEGGVLALTALALKRAQPGSWLATALIGGGMFGAAFFYGDGILTPAISVLGAVEGLEVISPVFHGMTVPIAAVLLVGLFLAQRNGTARVGALFGPVMGVWFAVLAALGVYGIAQHPGVLVALDPRHGFYLLMAGHTHPLLLLGAVVLAITGAEALYADMGHFGRATIRRIWISFVWPALILNYFGQGALLLSDPSTVENPFYLLAPEILRVPLLLLATMSAIIASQAVISGAFSVTSQAVELGWLPRVRIRHTSAREAGQIYVPQINAALMVGVLATVVGFESSSRLAYAYGIAVTGTMVITTLIGFYYYRRIAGWPLIPVLLVSAIFLTIDLSFLTSNLTKILEGGWLPIAVGFGLVIVMETWRRGRKLLAEQFLDGAVPLETLLKQAADQKIQRVKGAAVFLTANLDAVPTALLHNLKHNQVLHKRVALLRVSTEDTPRVPLSEQLKVETLPNGFARIEIRHGFMQQVDVPEQLERCRTFGLDFPPMETSYFVSRQTLVHEHSSKMPGWQSQLFILLMDYALSPTEYFQLPPNRVVELGTKTEV